MSETTDPLLARYADAARRVDAGDACDGCAATDGPFGAGNYDDLAGLPDAAVRVSLGCGNPIAVADLQPGDTVLDLGSGGGIDVLLSARRVGPTGFAYGLDATVEMLELARRNAAEAGATNVEFLHGSIEEIPLDDASVDVVISNCVIVLSGDKDATFCEIARVLRPGRSRRDQRHRPRRPRRRHPDQRLVRRRRHHARRLRGRPAPRRAWPTCTSPSPTRSAPACPTPSSGPRSRPSRSDRCGRGLAGGARHLRGRDRHRQRHVRDRGARPGSTGTPATFPGHRLVATDPDGAVIGWAALSPVSDRCVYAGVAENSVYVHPDHRGRGIGTDLLDALVAGAERDGYWTIQTGIFPENAASIATHERVGFRIVGRRERIGQLAGEWRDTLFLERRSTRI